jgi:hypothetical protein
MRFAPDVMRVDRIALAIGLGTSAAQDSASAPARDAALGSRVPVGSARKVTNQVTLRQHHRGAATMRMYWVTDRLHTGAQSRCLVTRSHPSCRLGLRSWAQIALWWRILARAACAGDWAAAYAVGDQLSVDVAVAAAA